VCDVLIIGNSFHIWTSLDSEKRICIPRVRGEGEGEKEKEREREREKFCNFIKTLFVFFAEN